MPNHITNCLRVKGDMKKFKEFIVDGTLDFAKIIPPPENMVRGDLGLDKMKELEAKGIPHWYGWQSENWGTKWNAYDGSVEKEEEGAIWIKFDTAWAPPEPIFAALVLMGYEVTGIWKDEGDDETHEINNDDGDWYTDTAFKVF